MEYGIDNLSPATNLLSLLDTSDIFKVNWNHNDLGSIWPLREDSKLILIITDFCKEGFAASVVTTVVRQGCYCGSRHQM